MDTIALIVLLTSLALAGGAAYWFLQWKSPTIKEKITSILAECGEEVEDINELEEITPAKIKENKKKVAEAVAEARKLRKKKPEELDEEEQETLEQLPKFEEIQTLTQKIETKEDLEKKVYGGWDWVYAAGIAVGVFLICQVFGNLIMKKVKGENV